MDSSVKFKISLHDHFHSYRMLPIICAPAIGYYQLLLLVYVSCVLKESEAKEKGNIAPPIAAVAGLTFSTLGESYYMYILCC